VKTIFVSLYLFVRSQTSLDHLVLSSRSQEILDINIQTWWQWKMQAVVVWEEPTQPMLILSRLEQRSRNKKDQQLSKVVIVCGLKGKGWFVASHVTY
jgi:hypothetical protein